MRSLAGLATVLICAAASAASAQTISPTTLNVSDAKALAVLNQAAFAPRLASESVDPFGLLIENEAHDTVAARLIVAHRQFDTQAYEVAVTRDWPGALSFQGRVFGLDVTPHAGVGVSDIGGSAEAGATLQLSKRESLSENASARLKALGLRDGAHFGDRGRWYLFAAASGRAVGLNMLHGETGWDRAGWTQDATSALVGDAQVGVGFRKGPVQTSLGYIHREVKGANMMYGLDSKPDSMVAFSLSIKPKY